MHHHIQSDPLATDSFPTDPSGLPEAGRSQLLELGPGDTLDLRVGPVAKHLSDTRVRMLGYNGTIPGPTLKVQQGSEIIVHVTTQGVLKIPHMSLDGPPKHPNAFDLQDVTLEVGSTFTVTRA